MIAAAATKSIASRTGDKGGTARDPVLHRVFYGIAYFTARDRSPLLTAAGLWEEWKDRQSGERLKSCTMIVTEPNDFAA